MMEQLLADLAALGTLDWLVTITALIYVVLSARNHAACWPFGIVSAGLWAYVSFVQYELYADALLQVYYVVMGFVGLFAWLGGGSGKKGEQGGGLPISRNSNEEQARYLVVGAALGLLLGYAFSHTQAAATYVDAMTTSFSILATIMLVRRRIDNWVYWIVIDLVYAGLYYSRGAMLFAALMLVYTVIAVLAFGKWRRMMGEE